MQWVDAMRWFLLPWKPFWCLFVEPDQFLIDWKNRFVVGLIQTVKSLRWNNLPVDSCVQMQDRVYGSWIDFSGKVQYRIAGGSWRAKTQFDLGKGEGLTISWVSWMKGETNDRWGWSRVRGRLYVVWMRRREESQSMEWSEAAEYSPQSSTYAAVRRRNVPSPVSTLQGQQRYLAAIVDSPNYCVNYSISPPILYCYVPDFPKTIPISVHLSSAETATVWWGLNCDWWFMD